MKRNSSRKVFALCVLLLLFVPAIASAGWWDKKKYYKNPTVVYDTMYVTVDALNVRSCPATKCYTEGAVYFGDTVSVVAKKGSWYKIKYGYSNRGWVYANYLSHTPPQRTVRSEVIKPKPQPVPVQQEVNHIYLDELREIQSQGTDSSGLPKNNQDIFQ